MKPNPCQVLAPTWLIVTHLLGAAVMLYFVSYPGTRAAPEIQVSSTAINVAELQPTGIVRAQRLENRITHQKQRVEK